MHIRKASVVLAAGLLVAASASGDVLKLKRGPGVQGTMISANSREIILLGVDGTQKSYPISDVAGIDFAPLPPPSAPKPAAAAARVMIPAGTELTVRMIDSIRGETAAASQRYRASVDDPVVVGSQVVIPRGANCSVQIAQLQGGAGLSLRLYDITVAGKTYSTATEYATVKAEGRSKGSTAARRGIGLGALGAGVGALAGGGKGAAIGAAVGGGVGAVSAAGAKGKQLNVPSESRLTFRLKAPLPLD